MYDVAQNLVQRCATDSNPRRRVSTTASYHEARHIRAKLRHRGTKAGQCMASFGNCWSASRVVAAACTCTRTLVRTHSNRRLRKRRRASLLRVGHRRTTEKPFTFLIRGSAKPPGHPYAGYESTCLACANEWQRLAGALSWEGRSFVFLSCQGDHVRASTPLPDRSASPSVSRSRLFYF